MSKRTWFMLLVIMITASLLVFTGCPNGATDDTGGEELFSFISVGEAGTAIYSTDGGVSWSTASDSGVETTNDLYGVGFDGTNFIAVGESGTVIYSSDKGASWNTASDSETETTLFLYGVAFEK